MQNKIIYIIDTCVLLNKKSIDIVLEDALEEDAVMTVPQKVQEELHGLLKNKKIRVAAVRAEQLVSRKKWRPLPHQGKFSSADDEILSYCRAHESDPLRVYTHDKGLKQKIAEACPHVEVASCNPECDYVSEYETELAWMEKIAMDCNPFYWDETDGSSIDRAIWEYLDND